jgi:hypothetical protein
MKKYLKFCLQINPTPTPNFFNNLCLALQFAIETQSLSVFFTLGLDWRPFTAQNAENR